MFMGFYDEGSDVTFVFQVLDYHLAAFDSDNPPTFRVYGADGVIESGTGEASLFEVGLITLVSKPDKIQIDSADHKITTGQYITIEDVGGAVEINGGHYIADVTAPDIFKLRATEATSISPYTSGGSWHTTGLYKVILTGAVLNSLEAGRTYTIVVSAIVNGFQYATEGTFTVR